MAIVIKCGGTELFFSTMVTAAFNISDGRYIWSAKNVSLIEQYCLPEQREKQTLPHLNPDWFYLSGTDLTRLSLKKGC